MKNKCVVLYSGGLDSAVMLYGCVKDFGKENVYPLYVNYGSKHHIKEYTVAVDNCARLGIPLTTINLDPSIFDNVALTGANQDVPDNLEDTIKVVVPFRNQCLVTFAAMLADKVGAENIYISPTKEDYGVFRDCRREFFDTLELSLKYGAKYDVDYNIITPHIYMTKEEVIQRGLDLGVDFDLTWSCYNPKEDGTACEVCPACRVRQKGFNAIQKAKENSNTQLN